MKKLFQKLKDSGGETLVETLVALLITVLAMVLLPTAITTAGKLNQEAREYVQDAPLFPEGNTDVSVVKVTASLIDEKGAVTNYDADFTGCFSKGFFYFSVESGH